MQAETNSITLTVSPGGLATVLLSQPERGNPIDGAFCREFRNVMNHLTTLPALRAVLIRAQGKHFSFGGDVKSFGEHAGKLPARICEWTSDLHMGLARAWRLPVPVIAEVQGWAMGGSVGLLAGADLVIASQSSRFGSAFAQLGFSCDSGTTVTLSMRMGAARARRFTLLAEVLSSADALACGLVDEVVADAELEARALAVAEKLAGGPTLAYGEVKRLFLRFGAAQMEAQMEDEAQTLTRIAASGDAQEAIAAFLQKRPPVFSGK